MSCSHTRYSLSLNNLLLTCRGNPLATVPRPCTDLQASSKFQILHVRGTANVDYRAVCRTPYSWLAFGNARAPLVRESTVAAKLEIHAKQRG